MPFLTAGWRDLVLVTYAVPPEALAPHLPPGCEPDLREGKAFVSLVAFDFVDTRVLGVRWPGGDLSIIAGIVILAVIGGGAARFLGFRKVGVTAKAKT